MRFNELDITALEADSKLLDVLLKRGVSEAGEVRGVADRLLAG